MNRQHDKPLQVKPVFWLFTHKMCSRTSMCQRCLTIIKLKCRWESQSMISFLIFLLAPKIPLSWPGWPQRHQTDDHSWSLGYGGSGGEEENKQNLCAKQIFAELNFYFQPEYDRLRPLSYPNTVRKWEKENKWNKIAIAGRFSRLLFRCGPGKLWKHWGKMAKWGHNLQCIVLGNFQHFDNF